MNWCMVGICAGCIPLLLLFKEKYTRLEVDAVNQQAKGSRKQIQAENEETPLISSSERGQNGISGPSKIRTDLNSTEV